MQAEMAKFKEAQRFVNISSETVHESRLECHRLACALDEAEGALNEGLGCMRGLVAAMTMATRHRRQDGQRTALFTKSHCLAEQVAQ